ncbi:MAG: M23 family metallopeptidase [Alphaproteobacteria bacterium]|nr:M23 family metallopeptidase [Alphaproteobacteria bacterium]
MSSLTRHQVKEALNALVADKRYWDHRHPEHDAFVAHVTGEFRRVYPGPYVPGSSQMYANDPQGGPEALVEVRAYSQSRDGNAVQVSEHTRAAPGTGAAQNGEAKSSAAKGTKSPIPKPVIRKDGLGDGHFEARRKGKDGKVYYHQGVDIEAKPGTEVKSPVDGTVTSSKLYKKGEYNDEFTYVWVEDGTGTKYGFGYVTPKGTDGKPVVKNGDKVKSGDKIGTVQDRARYDKGMKNHIHVEMKKDNHNVNPTKTIEDWQKQ